MTEQEKFNAEVQLRLAKQDAKFEVFMKAQDERFINFMNELQQQREDIRRLNEKHSADMQAINAKIDAKFDSLMNQLHNLTIAAFLGFGAIAVAIGGLVVSIIKQ